MIPTILAGNEPASFEKLTAALRKAGEAADGRNRNQCRRHVLEAVEGATELGTYLSDGRWAAVALSLEKSARVLAAMHYGDMLAAGPMLAEQFRNALVSVTLLRHGRVVH